MELFAADGHDAGECERVTGKSGMRPKALSDMTLSKLIKEQGVAAVPHGFRSSFRDWAAERTNHPREVIEAALEDVQNATPQLRDETMEPAS